MAGWFSVHRKLKDSTVFSDPFILKLWMLCLMKVSYTEHEQLVGTQVVKLQPGEFVTGRFALAEEYNKGSAPKNRVNDLTIWRWLKLLEKLEMLNIKSSNKFSVVTVLNWQMYQGNEQQMNIKRTTDEQQMNTNNKGNKENKGNKKDTVQHAELFESWWSLYGNKKGKVKCETKYASLLKKYSHEQIIEGTHLYLNHREGLAKRGEFVPQQKNPLTFLNGEHFNDEYEGSNDPVHVISKPKEYVPNFNAGED
ncbi:hypothetical protein HU147_18655 [Planomicrobium chinense]|uniref:hypothetical protein n=1 Tax=Planococcus chinensis TaxID=272917 RepID=UPI001CC4B0A1|nr:hypothetical protein [Planococcus chinensis]MBZ5203228.1 hypothetical protein [Planococcus chinensis]